MSTVVLIESAHIVRFSLKNKLLQEGYYVYDYDSFEKFTYHTEVVANTNLLLLAHPDFKNSLTHIEKLQEQKSVPIVLLTNSITKEEFNFAMNYGIIDFLLQPIRHDDIVTRISKILPNTLVTMSINDILRNEVARSKRGNTPVSIILLKIEATKTLAYNQLIKINKVLKELCMKYLRATDVVTQIGNKILIILPLTPKNSVKVVTDRLFEKLKDLEVDYDITDFQFGYVSMPEDCDNHQEILRLANDRLEKRTKV